VPDSTTSDSTTSDRARSERTTSDPTTSDPTTSDRATISRAEVAHLARLARLALSDDELDRFAGQLDVIITSVARVAEVAADDIPPTSHSLPLTNVMREDVSRPGLTQAEVLSGAPAAEQGRFRVPRILDEEA
jgi:aspartyl-tRNA(Asn)/glutamyl-tRNA(Gln) amidotransferase subunit C